MLLDVASDGVQVATAVGPVEAVLHCWLSRVRHTDEPAGAVQPQVVVVQLFQDLADCGSQLSTLVGPVVMTGQVVAVQAGVVAALAATGVHELTGLGPLVTVGQAVVVQELPELALATVQAATPAEVV